jgi:two-component system, NarL family, sensor kinase
MLYSSVDTLCSKVKEIIGLEYKLDYSAMENNIINIENGIVFFRILQEAINNIIKHSQAKEYYIKFITAKEFIKLIIIDDGIGFNIENIIKEGKANGLKNIENRIRSIGGEMLIESSLGNGTKIIISLNRVM